MPQLASAPPHLHVLAWDRPLLVAAVDWLTEGWDRSRALDLSDTLVIVPTRQSGRRLRQALAARAAGDGQAVFPPRVIQPEQVLRLAASVPGGGEVARAALLLAWVRTLQAADLEALREVFPTDPPRRTFRWALELAEDFVRLQEILEEGGLRFGDVAPRAGQTLPERERWEQLAWLEARFDEQLAEMGWAAPAAVQRATAETPAGPPPGVRRVVLLATPDPRPLVVQVLSAWMSDIEVYVAIYAAPGGADWFDPWGRPRPEHWTEAPFDFPDFEQRVHVCADPAAQGAALADWTKAYAGGAGRLALGCADPALVPQLAAALSARGLTPFRPEGELLERHALAVLIEALLAAVREDSWEAVAALARHEIVLAWLGRRVEGFSAARFLAALDGLQARHLPGTLGDARRQAGDPAMVEALRRISELLAGLRDGRFPGAWNEALATLFAGRFIDTLRPEGHSLTEAAEAWRLAVAAVAPAAPADLASADGCLLALRLLAASRRFPDRPEGAVEIDGWLELLFRGEPHLIVAGCNDGSLPDAITGHAFIPEALRERLGLKTNAQRLARDAWQLAALAASRAGGGPSGGRLDLLLGQTSAAGDPLRPSRLLVLCEEAELPRRVAWLFRRLQPSDRLVPWQRAWKLRPPRAPAPAKLRVTAFRDYLRCPFRFYLKHVLHLEPVEPDKRELDGRDFGHLVHGVLERLGRDQDWRDATDDRALAAAFAGELDRLVAGRYGRALSLPVVVQVESARQRLAHAAKVQAAARAEGWVIEHVEWSFPAGELMLGGLPISGTIDRIERHTGTGRWRVLDYKTGESALAPAAAHLRSRREGDQVEFHLQDEPPTGGARPRTWVDLQLPLYRWALRRVLGVEEVDLGYFNLPKAVAETGVALWEDHAGRQESALRCAQAVAEAVRSGRFWPPAEDVRHDEFAALFHEGAAESVAWEEER